MTLKFIQVNIYKGKYLGDLIEFLRDEKADFIAVQEVTWGLLNHSVDKKANLFEVLKNALSMNGVCNFDWKVEGSVGSLGNAVFSKYPIVKSNVTVLREPVEVKFELVESEKGFPGAPRHIIDALCKIKGVDVHVISWHGAWTAPPTDTAETLRQSEIVRDYLADLNALDQPFLVGSDLNSTPDKETVKMIGKVATNLMVNSNIGATTHPTVHKIAPRGFLVDYIFTSKHFELVKLEAPEITVSDHLPVVASLEYKV